ncbi:hypothetical protein HPB48_026850 [Haemaphysalis longicornis]|uniref:Uncharacterized protein n=1 Tax=Haemaphysalis longicornis TaxID=44386 RepID=A0A9J6HBS3_HAELO|nr:hypothetical protein HPB48_026850 [Haemaphysalis longicornis]
MLPLQCVLLLQSRRSQREREKEESRGEAQTSQGDGSCKVRPVAWRKEAEYHALSLGASGKQERLLGAARKSQGPVPAKQRRSLLVVQTAAQLAAVGAERGGGLAEVALGCGEGAVPCAVGRAGYDQLC